MLNLFKKKCPICKMVLEKDKKYPKRSGIRFCSEKCIEKHRKDLREGGSSSGGGGSCH